MKMAMEKKKTIGNLSKRFRIRKHKFVEMHMILCLPERANQIPGIFMNIHVYI